MARRSTTAASRAIVVFVLCFASVMASALVADAATIVITMDEVATQPADGLIVEGVRFNGNATFNAGSGTTAFLNCPCTSGSANQTFVLGFVTPTRRVQISLARAGGTDVRLTFQGAGELPQVFNLTLKDEGFGVREVRFQYQNKFHPIQHLFIEFPTQGGDFAIDNLRYDT